MVSCMLSIPYAVHTTKDETPTITCICNGSKHWTANEGQICQSHAEENF